MIFGTVCIWVSLDLFRYLPRHEKTGEREVRISGCGQLQVCEGWRVDFPAQIDQVKNVRRDWKPEAS